MIGAAEAIAAIGKLLPLIPSLTGARRKAFFKGVIVPLFEALDDIHDEYCEIFTTAQTAFIALDGATAYQQVPTVEQLAERQRILDAFMNARGKDEHLRDALRVEAQDIFKAIRWSEERRFVASVAYYFLLHPVPIPTHHMIDRDIERVMEHGGIREWDTPSIKVYLDLKDSSSSFDAVEILRTARDQINESYVNARRNFKAVQRQLILKA